jgi:FAD/FMN-containing dehydrogenase
MNAAGWGRYPIVAAREVCAEDLASAARGAALSCGLRRSYGDAALPADAADLVCRTTRADCLLLFDEANGIVRAEAGISLQHLNRSTLPRGWFVPVTPGTQNVTLGGMIAADVHGKNHHVAGCFGAHVRRMAVMVADGSVVECTPRTEPELFWATIGGMGLTGHILDADVALERVEFPWIYQETQRVGGLGAMIEGLRTAAAGWPMTVGWIDCLAGGPDLGRGILMKGRWAMGSDCPPAVPPVPMTSRTVPVPFPNFALARWNMRLFNAFYYRRHPAAGTAGIVAWERFFYPLDGLRDWNRVYGRRGFTQYQCVLPHTDGGDAMRGFLELFVQLGGTSFLSVIKDCGPEGGGLLSFPKAGISVALDFPVDSRRTQRLVDRLNEYVIAHGGRVYLAKDAFTRAEHYRAMDDRIDRFLDVRRRWDPEGRLRSSLSVRIFGDKP